jgi:hypothetical protein
VFTARYALSPYIKQICFAFKRLKKDIAALHCYTSMWDVKDRQKENWATEYPVARHVQESGRRTVVTSSQELDQVEHTDTTFVKATYLGIDHLGIKHWSYPWVHHEALSSWD